MYQLFLSIFIVYVFFLNLPLFLNEKVSGLVAPSIYIGFIVGAAPFVLLKIEYLFKFLKSSFFLWLLVLSCVYAFTIWRIAYFEISVSDEEYVDIVNALERHALIFLIAYCIFCINKDLLRKIFIPVTILIPILVIWDLLLPQDFLGLNSEVGSRDARASATFLNPNLAAEAMICSLLIFYNQLSKRLLGILIIIAGIGVLATFSRSGLGGWLIVSVYFVTTGRVSWYLALIPVLFIVFYGLFNTLIEDLLLVTTGGNEGRVENLLDRLSFFGRVGSEGIDEAGDTSSEGRLGLLVDTWNAILDKPFLGHGIKPVGLLDNASHNLALEHWFVSGLFGLFAVLLIGILVYRRTKKHTIIGISPFLLYYFWSIWFNHQHFTVLPWLIAFMIVLYMEADTDRVRLNLGGNSATRKRRKKRRKRRKSQWESSAQTTA